MLIKFGFRCFFFLISKQTLTIASFIFTTRARNMKRSSPSEPLSLLSSSHEQDRMRRANTSLRLAMLPPLALTARSSNSNLQSRALPDLPIFSRSNLPCMTTTSQEKPELLSSSVALVDEEDSAAEFETDSNTPSVGTNNKDRRRKRLQHLVHILDMALALSNEEFTYTETGQ